MLTSTYYQFFDDSHLYIPKLEEMVAGGVMYESQQAIHSGSDMDWTSGGMRRIDDMMDSGSSNYSHSVGPDQSPYDGHATAPPGSAGSFHTPYPNMSGTHLPMQMPQYPRQHYHTPSSSIDYGNFSYQDDYNPQIMYDTQPLLTSTSLRMYDTTIPTYYPIVPDQRSWNQTPVKEEKAGTKRKREKSSRRTPPPSGRLMKTPKKNKEDGPPSKRAKDRENSQQSQLPTPPSSGRDISYVSLPAHLQLPIQVEEAPLAPRSRGVVVTRHSEEGRKLGLVGTGQVGTEPEEVTRSPRMTTVPSLSTSDSGRAVVSTGEVLESEMAWLQNPSPTSVAQPQTPPMSSEALFEEGPEQQEERTIKRLQAFAPGSPTSEMVSTRVGPFGRVAVRKDTAAKFLGLDGTDLVEEKEEDEWRPMAGSSKAKPSWPDQLAPWSLAGGGRKEKMQREITEKAALLKRYLETSSDDSSDEDITPTSRKGKGKSTPDRRRRLSANFGTVSTNAKSALIASIRNRPLPPFQSGVVACVCGNPSLSMGSLISCASCKTWHHIVCCGLEDDAQIGSQWWCAACEHQANSLTTPARRVSRPMYAQSDERSAFKGNHFSDIALAPSPMFAAKTPQVGRTVQSPGRPQRSRVLSYGVDMWANNDDPPSTPSRPDRFSTPKIDDAPFDVHSTPSRHIDFSFGQPSLFSLTPLGGRSRVTSHLGMGMEVTPLRSRNPTLNTSFSEALPKNDFFRELNKGPSTVGAEIGLGSPSQARWHGLMGAHNLSPSPFAHRRTMSGNKLSSMRSSSRSGLGLGMGEKKEDGDIEEQ